MCRTIKSFIATLLILVSTASAEIGRAAISDREKSLSIEEALSALSFPFRTPSDLSPNGQWLAYTLQDPRKGRSVSEEERSRYFTETGVAGSEVGCDVWITHVDSHKSRNLTEGKGSSWGPAWSPDGKYLAFYSDRGGRAHLWVWDSARDRLNQITGAIVRPRDGFDAIRWSRDGTRVLVKILPEGITLEEANQAITSSESVRGEDEKYAGASVRIYRSPAKTAPLRDNQDPAVQQNPQSRALRADLALLDIHTSKIERIAHGYYPLWYGLSPDGQSLAFITNKGQQGNNNFRTLYDLVVVHKSERPQVVAAGITQAALWFAASWSPDGKWLSYALVGEGACYLVSSSGGTVRKVTGLPAVTAFLRPPLWDRSSENVYVQTARSLWRVPAKDGAASEVVQIPGHGLTAVIGPRDGSELWTTDNGASIAVTTIADETKQSGFFKVDLKTGRYHKLFEEDVSYGLDQDFHMDVSDDGTVVTFTAEDGGTSRNFLATNSSFHQRRAITNINPQFNRQRMGKARIIEWRSLSGQTLRGVLVLPSRYVEGTRYPLIVRVHGGWMQSDVINNFGFMNAGTFDNLQLLATRGYALLLPDAPLNVRTPMKDLADTILPGVNKVIEMGVADPDRLGAVGQSFGGYSTLGLLVQTTRFRAAIVRSAFSSLISIYGEMHRDGSAYGIGIMEDGSGRMRGTPWEHRERYIENSPFFYLDRIQTPLLIVHGNEDTVTAPFLADEIFVGLRRLGKEVVYAKYDGEGHGLRNYANQLDYWRRAIAWFDKHLQAADAGNR